MEGSTDPAEKQAEILHSRMREVGVPHTLVMTEGYGHVNFYGEMVIWDFLEKALKSRYCT